MHRSQLHFQQSCFHRRQLAQRQERSYIFVSGRAWEPAVERKFRRRYFFLCIDCIAWMRLSWAEWVRFKMCVWWRIIRRIIQLGDSRPDPQYFGYQSRRGHPLSARLDALNLSWPNACTNNKHLLHGKHYQHQRQHFWHLWGFWAGSEFIWAVFSLKANQMDAASNSSCWSRIHEYILSLGYGSSPLQTRRVQSIDLLWRFGWPARVPINVWLGPLDSLCFETLRRGTCYVGLWSTKVPSWHNSLLSNTQSIWQSHSRKRQW